MAKSIGKSAGWLGGKKLVPFLSPRFLVYISDPEKTPGDFGNILF
jgi:hypothetical protein